MARKKDVLEENIYKNMEDDELVILAKDNHYDAIRELFRRYKYLIKYKAKKYYAPGVDEDDLIQEGNIGLYNSIRDYKLEHPTQFRVFCELCIQRQIITAVKTATRQKHNPLNKYVSVDKPMYEEESDRTLHDVIENKKQQTPEDILIDRENVYEILAKLKDRLSPFEALVLEGQLQKMAYQDIAEEVGRPVKSIDNAMQRIRDKLDKIVLEMRNPIEGNEE